MSAGQSTDFLHHLFEAGNSLFVQLLIPLQVYHHTSNNNWPESQHMFITPSNTYLYHPSTTQPLGCDLYPNYVASTQSCIRRQPNSLHHSFVQNIYHYSSTTFPLHLSSISTHLPFHPSITTILRFIYFYILSARPLILLDHI